MGLNYKFLFFFSLISLKVLSQEDSSNLNIKTFASIPDSILHKKSYDLAVNNYHFDKALEAFSNNNFEKAISFYNGYLNEVPDDPIAIFNRGICFYKMHEYNHACPDFKFASYFGLRSALVNYKSLCDSSSIILNSFLDSGIVSRKIALSKEKTENIYTSPEFPGGLDSLNAYLIYASEKNFLFNYSLDPNKRAIVKVKIDSHGKVSKLTYKSDDFFNNKSVMQIISSMPQWRPALKNGIPFECEFYFPFINTKAFRKLSYKKYNEGVSQLNKGNFINAISLFDFSILFDHNDYDAFFNRGVAYFRMKDISQGCMDMGKAYLGKHDSNSVMIINKYCDSLVEYHGEKKKITEIFSLGLDPVFTVVEEMPQFPGGENKLFEYLARVIYPAEAREKGISGKVYIGFEIYKDGSVRNTKIIRGIGGGCDEEALRIINSMPNWKPGKQDGKVVNVNYILPINFNLR